MPPDDRRSPGGCAHPRTASELADSLNLTVPAQHGLLMRRNSYPDGSPTLAWGWSVWGEAGRCLSRFSGPVLHALAEPVDDAGDAASAHVAPSAGVRQAGTRRSDEATLDQLHRVEGGEQVLGAGDTLQAAHGLQA